MCRLAHNNTNIGLITRFPYRSGFTSQPDRLTKGDAGVGGLKHSVQCDRCPSIRVFADVNPLTTEVRLAIFSRSVRGTPAPAWVGRAYSERARWSSRCIRNRLRLRSCHQAAQLIREVCPRRSCVLVDPSVDKSRGDDSEHFASLHVDIPLAIVTTLTCWKTVLENIHVFPLMNVTPFSQRDTQ